MHKKGRTNYKFGRKLVPEVTITRFSKTYKIPIMSFQLKKKWFRSVFEKLRALNCWGGGTKKTIRNSTKTIRSVVGNGRPKIFMNKKKVQFVSSLSLRVRKTDHA